MQKKLSSSIGLLLLVATLLVSVDLSRADSQQDELKDFNEVLNLAKRLESAKFILHKMSDAQHKDRVHSIYRFVKATKSPYCDKKFDETLKLASEYKIKAYELVKESKKINKGWFSNVVGNSFGPISKLRGISKSDAYLSDITKQYEAQSKSGLLTEQKVDCDVNKYKVKTLHEILLILQAEIKYLVTEPINVINRAIYDRLKADQFISMSNFYDAQELNEAQRQLVLEFLAHRRDISKMTVGQAEDHYYNPGAFVVGRLLETCQLLGQFSDRLTNNSKENSQVCTDSSMDPLGNLFAEQFKSDCFDSTISFCDHLLAAL